MTLWELESALYGYKDRIEWEMQRQDNLNHALGRYFQAAIAASFSKSSHYPDEPFLAQENKQGMSTDIEGTLRKIGTKLGAKHGRNDNR